MSNLVVYESVPRNAATLARLAPVKLVEVRSLMQLKRAVERDPATIIAMEITQPQNLPAAANLIHWIKRERARTAVIAMPLVPFPPASAWLYESGVDAIFESMLDRDFVRKLMCRALARASRGSEVEESGSFRERVVASLPWQRFAT